MYISTFYAWDTRAKRGVGCADNSTKGSSPAAHTSDVGAGAMADKGVVQIAVDEDVVDVSIDSFDEDLHCKKLSVNLGYPRK